MVQPLRIEMVKPLRIEMVQPLRIEMVQFHALSNVSASYRFK